MGGFIPGSLSYPRPLRRWCKAYGAHGVFTPTVLSNPHFDNVSGEIGWYDDSVPAIVIPRSGMYNVDYGTQINSDDFTFIGDALGSTVTMAGEGGASVLITTPDGNPADWAHDGEVAHVGLQASVHVKPIQGHMSALFLPKGTQLSISLYKHCWNLDRFSSPKDEGDDYIMVDAWLKVTEC